MRRVAIQAGTGFVVAASFVVAATVAWNIKQALEDRAHHLGLP